MDASPFFSDLCKTDPWTVKMSRMLPLPMFTHYHSRRRSSSTFFWWTFANRVYWTYVACALDCRCFKNGISGTISLILACKNLGPYPKSNAPQAVEQRLDHVWRWPLLCQRQLRFHYLVYFYCLFQVDSVCWPVIRWIQRSPSGLGYSLCFARRPFQSTRHNHVKLQIVHLCQEHLKMIYLKELVNRSPSRVLICWKEDSQYIRPSVYAMFVHRL